MHGIKLSEVKSPSLSVTQKVHADDYFNINIRILFGVSSRFVSFRVADRS